MAKKKAAQSRVSDQELAAALEVPATLSNKTYVTMTPFGVRITFAEAHENVKDPKCHTAVFMNPLDCIQLRDLLSSAVERFNITHDKPNQDRTLQ